MWRFHRDSQSWSRELSSFSSLRKPRPLVWNLALLLRRKNRQARHSQEGATSLSWAEHKKNRIRPYLKLCKQCPKEEKDRLFALRRAERDNNYKEAIDIFGSKTKSEVFIATFGLCPDNCVDENKLNSLTLNAMKKAGLDCEAENLYRELKPPEWRSGTAHMLQDFDHWYRTSLQKWFCSGLTWSTLAHYWTNCRRAASSTHCSWKTQT